MDAAVEAWSYARLRLHRAQKQWGSRQGQRAELMQRVSDAARSCATTRDVWDRPPTEPYIVRLCPGAPFAWPAWWRACSQCDVRATCTPPWWTPARPKGCVWWEAWSQAWCAVFLPAVCKRPLWGAVAVHVTCVWPEASASLVEGGTADTHEAWSDVWRTQCVMAAVPDVWTHEDEHAMHQLVHVLLQWRGHRWTSASSVARLWSELRVLIRSWCATPCSTQTDAPSENAAHASPDAAARSDAVVWVGATS
jgi:hypothetical protein